MNRWIVTYIKNRIDLSEQMWGFLMKHYCCFLSANTTSLNMLFTTWPLTCKVPCVQDGTIFRLNISHCGPDMKCFEVNKWHLLRNPAIYKWACWYKQVIQVGFFLFLLLFFFLVKVKFETDKPQLLYIKCVFWSSESYSKQAKNKMTHHQLTWSSCTCFWTGNVLWCELSRCNS